MGTEVKGLSDDRLGKLSRGSTTLVAVLLQTAQLQPFESIGEALCNMAPRQKSAWPRREVPRLKVYVADCAAV